MPNIKARLFSNSLPNASPGLSESLAASLQWAASRIFFIFHRVFLKGVRLSNPWFCWVAKTAFLGGRVIDPRFRFLCENRSLFERRRPFSCRLSHWYPPLKPMKHYVLSSNFLGLIYVFSARREFPVMLRWLSDPHRRKAPRQNERFEACVYKLFGRSWRLFQQLQIIFTNSVQCRKCSYSASRWARLGKTPSEEFLLCWSPGSLFKDFHLAHKRGNMKTEVGNSE